MLKSMLLFGLMFLTYATFSQIPSYVPSNGLVGWWPFNGNTNDESGNGNHGINFGGTFTLDRFGSQISALYLDGVSRIDVGNLNLGLSNSSYTYANWFKTGAQSNPHRTMIADYNSSVSDDNIFACWHYLESTNLAHTGARNYPIGFSVPSNTILNNNQWHYIITTLDRSTNLMSIYIDGILNNFVSLPPNINFNENSFLRFGIHKWNNTFQNGFFWLGELDDIGIWNRTLTECEIQNLYTSQLNVISQAISAGPDQNICSGDNVTLNGTGGNNFQWNNNVVDGQAFSPTLSNNYVVSAQDTLGCTGTDTVMVTVLENATSILAETALDSYTLNGQTYTQSGTYTQTVPAANGCDSVITLILNLNYTGINQPINSAICLFPNPASDQLIINANVLFNGKPYAIYDQRGKVLLNGILNKPSTSISLSGFTNGLYIFKIEGHGMSTFVVQKE